MLLLALLACTPSGPEASAGSGARILFRPTDIADVSLPQASRPASELGATDAPLEGPWTLVRTVEGVDELSMPLPVRGSTWRQGEAPLDLAVNDPAGAALPFEVFDAPRPKVGSWGLDGEKIVVRIPAGAAHPKGLRLACPRSWERERGLNFSSANLDANAFALRTVRVRDDSWTGLLLPAPASATWTVDVPAGGTLAFEASVLPPEVAGAAPSDGATLVVTGEGTAGPVELGRFPLATGEWKDARLDLTPLAGQKVKLAFKTEAGATDAFDYVFVASPRVYAKSVKPKRAVLVFVDTLRPDHMSLYGYERATTPNIDAWAKDAAVFTQARTVAPWTLPSARAMLSGRKPEAWGTGDAFPQLFASRGYLPKAVVTNNFLGEGFGMTAGWAEHHSLGFVRAEQPVGQALEWLERHPDEDLALLVHLMDPHLPYREPEPFRSTWAGANPANFKELLGKDEVDRLKVDKMPPEKAAPIKQFLMDRYDQSILYADSQLKRLFDALGPDAVVVLVSDHGEEFWEHGGFEHGHSLYDELLHVPMIVKAPGLPATRSDVPTSLVDVVPTMLDLLAAPEPGLEGQALAAVAREDEAVRTALTTRAQAIGRKLYGRDRWGVVSGGRKWITSDGRQQLFDLAADPGERADLAPATSLDELDRYRQQLAGALGIDVPYAWRLFTQPFRPRSDQLVHIKVEHPSGIQAAWRAYDWKGPKSEFVATIEVKDGVAEIVQPAGQLAPSEIFVLPNGDPRDPRGVRVTVDVGGTPVEATWGMDRKVPPVKPDAPTAFAKPFNGDVRWVMDLAVQPKIEEKATSDFNPDSLEQLRLLGYVQ